MTDEQFERLVTQLEGEARSRPGLYRVRVILLGLLGNAYLFAVLLLVVALLAALLVSIVVLKALAVKLAVVVGAFVWVILKSIWVTIEPPEGIEITRAQAPELFALIDELGKALQAPRFHHVLVTDALNAGVAQAPRLGIFGWPRNYLMIGLPLMKALTVDQFKAVLAHEFGHLARGHGTVSNWIYRQRLRWAKLLRELGERRSKGEFLFRPFLNWYAPYFSAYSFPLARANEYEADATSVRLTSQRAVASALSTVEVVGSFLSERFWPMIHHQADEQSRPELMPFMSMSHGVAERIDQASAQQWLQSALAGKTTLSDTHPSLADRLHAIGSGPLVEPPPPGAAADRLLGSRLAAITERLDRQWASGIQSSWEERYRTVQDGRRRLAALDGKADTGEELTLQEAYDRAKLTDTIGDDAARSLAQLRALHQRAPDDAVVCMALGALLLRDNDESGCALVEHAMDIDEDSAETGSVLLRDFCFRVGRIEAAHAWNTRALDSRQRREQIESEGRRVLLTDTFARNELPEPALAALRQQLRSIQNLGKAYYVRKISKADPARQCFVCGFRVAGSLPFGRDKRVAQVLQQMQSRVEFPGETLIIHVGGQNYRFGRKFMLMRGSRIV